jgi:hypothetical protein
MPAEPSSDLTTPPRTSPTPSATTETATECADGSDNDGNGRIDLDDATGCTGSGDDDEYTAPTECADGSDNDGNGRIDLDDATGCSGSGDDDEFTPESPSVPSTASATAPTASPNALTPAE